MILEISSEHSPSDPSLEISMGSDPLETSRINSFSMGVAWREPSSSSVRLGALDPALVRDAMAALARDD